MTCIKQGKVGPQVCCHHQSHHWDLSIPSQGFHAAFAGQGQDASVTCVTRSDTPIRLFVSTGIALKCGTIPFFSVVHNNALSFWLHSKQIIENSKWAAILGAVPNLVYLSSISDWCSLNETFWVPSSPSSSYLKPSSRPRSIIFVINHIISFFIVHSNFIIKSSGSGLVGFTKPGGNMVRITGNLCGKVCKRINDDYGRWCGFTVLGKDGRDILILTVYNVSQDNDTGNTMLYSQQQSFITATTLKQIKQHISIQRSGL